MRRLAAAAFAFAAGIFAAQYLLPSGCLLAISALCAAAGLLGLAFHGHTRQRILLIAWGLALAFAWNWVYLQTVQVPAEQLAGTTVQNVSMTLCDYPAAAKYGAKVTVRLDGLRGKAIYYGDESLLGLEPGNVIIGDVSFSSAARMRDEDITTFTSKGVFLLAYGKGDFAVEEGSVSSIHYWPQRMARAMQTKIAELYTADTAGFLTAILTGNKSSLSDDAAADLAEAGLYHILAVSGTHCALLLGFVEILMGRQRRRLTAAVAVPLLVFFMLLTGASPSVVRSCVMLLFLLAAPLFNRERDALTAIGAALALILLANPFAAASVSLQLSFAAIAGMLWLTPKGIRAFQIGKKRNPIAKFVVFNLSATLGATVFTLPLTAVYFHILCLAAPISAILCLWAGSLIFGLGLLSVLAGAVFLPLGQVIAVVPRALVWYFLHAAHLLANIPYHAVYFANPYLKYWLAFAYGLFALAYFLRGTGKRKFLLAAGLCALTLLVTVRLGILDTANAQLRITVLDVGQGESVLLSSDGEFALIDCGSANSWYDAGEIAAQNLQSAGCFQLKALLLTHFDADHVNGAADLMNRMNVQTVYLPDVQDDSGMRESVLAAASAHDTAVHFVTKQETVSLGEAAVCVYPPLGDTGDNEQGLTFLCSKDGYEALVTGDMSDTTEKKLLETYQLPDLELLVAGHHGSKDSTSLELLNTLKPETAIVSVGSNSYGHPAEQTLRRLNICGAQVFRTDQQGTITITVN